MTALCAVWGADSEPGRTLSGLLDDEPLRSEAGRRVERADVLSLAVGWSASASSDRLRPRIATDPSSRWTIAFDGRLDARSDLARACGLESTTDVATLVAAAFERWGARAPGQLEGDFALLAYDRRERRLHAARDRFGMRTLYWFASGSRIAFAPTPQALVRHAGAPRRPNLAVLAEAIVGDFTEHTATLLRDVHPVRAAHVTTFDRPDVREPRLEVFWRPDPWNVDRRSSPRELADRLRDGLVASVRERTEEIAGVGVLASGGLDSSSVAGVAARPLGRTDTVLVSYVTPGLGCDESHFIDRLAAHTGQRSALVRPREAPITLEETPWLELFHPSLHFFGQLAEASRQEGLSVVMSGAGSDELQNRTTLEADEFLRRRAWRDAARYAGLYDEPLELGGYVRLLRSAYRVLAPERLQRWRRARARRRVQGWLTSRAHDVLDAAEAERDREAAPFAHPEPLRSLLCRDLTQGPGVMSDHPTLQRLYGARGLSLAAPFLDERLADFLLTMPTEAMTAPGMIKPTLREAMIDTLPRELCWRRNPTSYAELHERTQLGLREAWRALLADSRLAALGLVDPRALARTLDVEGSFTRWDIPSALAAELWLRQLETAPSVAPR
jgi:asparagine synthase (glutamine-hydrolysing)